MKRFHNETRGLLRDSDDYERIRNRIYNDLREQVITQKENALAAGAFAAEVKVDHDNHYTLLIGLPEQVESHHPVAVLNYFGFPLNIEEDNYYR